MTEKLHVARYGPHAVSALARVLGECKAGDPLAPVTVVCPNRYSQLSLRRRLAAFDAGLLPHAGLLPDDGPHPPDQPANPPRAGVGIANVTFQSLDDFIDSLAESGSGDLGKWPEQCVRFAAMRSALDRSPSPFACVLGHPAAEAQLLRALEEVSTAEEGALEELRRLGQRSAELARLANATAAKLQEHGYRSRSQFSTLAKNAVLTGKSYSGKVGTAILYLPSRIAPQYWDVLRVLSEKQRLTAIIGFTGDDEADLQSQEMLQRFSAFLGPAVGMERLWASRSNHAVASFFVAPDSDTEVREAVRQVATRVKQGVHTGDIAICYAGQHDYARLVHEYLAEAGLPYVGQSPRPIGGHWAGRTVLYLLMLMEGDLPREGVCDLLSAGPLRQSDGSLVKGPLWVQISKLAGIVGGSYQWTSRLKAFCAQGRSSNNQDRREIARVTAEASQLRLFVQQLSDDLSSARSLSRWKSKAEWCLHALHNLLGSSAQRSHWPDSEFEAAQAVEAILDRLATLDDLDPNPTWIRFQDALSAELMGTYPHEGSVGAGVLVAPVISIAGMSFDTVCVVGLSDRSFPGSSSATTIVREDERSVLALPDANDKVTAQRHGYLAGLASAQRTVRSYARLEQDSKSICGASEWMRLGTADNGAVNEIESFSEWLVRAADAPSSQARSVASLYDWLEHGRPIASHPLAIDSLFGRVLELLDARRKATLSPWEGGLLGVEFPSISEGDIAVSATRLESYAACPRRYFFTHVLRIKTEKAPEQTQTISALNRGLLIHEILQRFVDGHLDTISNGNIGNTPPLSTLLEIAEETFARYEGRGLTGAEVIWQAEQQTICEDLTNFYRQYQSDLSLGIQPIATELSFGIDDDEGTLVLLPNGRKLRFRGYIDRVDLLGEGNIRVLDYKTGDSSEYSKVSIDPVGAGTALQLPLYALAAQQRFNSTKAWAGYSFVSKRGKYKLLGYDVGEPQIKRLSEVLDVLLDGIERGRFPSHPGEKTRLGLSNCARCNFESCCPDRERSWDRQRSDPSLSRYVALVEPANP